LIAKMILGYRFDSEVEHLMNRRIEPLKPILTAHLFPKIDGMLIELLRSLAPEDWEKQTVSPKWKVKDVAAHLLDTSLRGVSIGRDGYRAESPKITSAEDLATFINRLNSEGVIAYRRLSPLVLIRLVEVAAKSLAEFHASRDPYATAPYGVSWAGEEKSANWFDTAREFTERWHHQQQIRLAVNKPGIMTRELYYPVLDCFLRALPFTYRNVSAKPAHTLRSSSRANAEAAGICIARKNRGSSSKSRAVRKFLKQPFSRKSPGASSPRASTGNLRYAR